MAEGDASRGPAGAADAGTRVIDAAARLPGGRELLALADERPRLELALVGGAVRDLLLGRTPRELDATLASGAAAAAIELRSRLGDEDAEVTLHERFGTAVLSWPAGRVDLAERRAESYAHPGALPEVRRGSAEEDLRRRDFTVNAMAVPLAGEHAGALAAAAHAQADLDAGVLRVLHEESFIDDPTRLLRLGRYVGRLGFAVEPATLALARSALDSGALQTISGGRVGAELRLALAEAAAGPLQALGELGVLGALGLPNPFDDRLLAEARELLPAGTSAQALALGILFRPAGGSGDRASATALMDRFELTASERERALACAFDAGAIAAELAPPRRPSELRALLGAVPLEAVAVAGALAGREDPAARARAADWLGRLRGMRLAIDGEDLLRAGVAQGPEIGRLLGAVLDMRMDGAVGAGREEQLAAALRELP